MKKTGFLVMELHGIQHINFVRGMEFPYLQKYNAVRILMVTASFHIKRDVIGKKAMIQPMGVAYLSSYLRSKGQEVYIKLRNNRYKGFIVLGGHSSSLNFVMYIKECRGINCSCIGEGEITLSELFTCLERNEDWYGIAF